MATRIVDQMIRRLKAPDANHYTEWDSAIPGFGVRITATGVISFILDYRIHGRHRRYTIGRYPDEYSATAARTRAGELRQRIREGHDPMEERNQSRLEPTLGELLTEYVESEAELKKRPRTVREDKRMVEKIIRPRLGSYHGFRESIRLHDCPGWATASPRPSQSPRLVSTVTN